MDETFTPVGDIDHPVWLAFHQNVGPYKLNQLYQLPLSEAEVLVNQGLAYWAQP